MAKPKVQKLVDNPQVFQSNGLGAGLKRTVEGVVTKSGQILVGNTVVATNGTTYYVRTTDSTTGKNGFSLEDFRNMRMQSTKPIYVTLDANGKYLSAAAKGCGNPLKGFTAVAVQPKPQTPATPEKPAEPEKKPTEQVKETVNTPVAKQEDTPVTTVTTQTETVATVTPKGAETPVRLPKTGAADTFVTVLGAVGVTYLATLLVVTARRRLF